MITKSDWIKYFPYKNVRPEQEKGINFILNSFNSGKRYVIGEFAPGTGKSAIAVTVSKYLNENTMNSLEEKNKSYIVTTQKVLQEQYIRDFPDIANITAKQNYQCANRLAGITCDMGLTMSRILLKDPAKQIAYNESCVYKKAKKKFDESTLSLTNLSYYMYHSDIKVRNLLVIDECHNIESVVTDFASISFTKYFVEQTLKMPYPPVIKMSIDEVVKWIKTSYVSKLSQMCVVLGDKISNGTNSTYLQSNSGMGEMKKFEDYKQKLDQINMFTENYTKDDWVISISPTQDVVNIKPIYADKFTKPMLFSTTNKILLMSGTILNKNTFCNSIGINPDSAAYMTIDSPFPVKNRPIFTVPIGSMSKKSIDSTLPKMVSTIKELMEYHKNEKGIIFCVNYNIAKYIEDNINDSRLLFHSSDDRIDVLNFHINSSEPSVLVSPSLTEGIDLTGDRSRFQMIVKCLSKDTRLVTERGFKYYNEIDKNDIIFSLTNDGKMVKRKIDAILIEQYSGKMLEIKNTQQSMCVTPDHRIMLKLRKDYGKRPYMYLTANNDGLFTKDYAFPSAPEGYDGKKYDIINLIDYINDDDVIVLINPTVRAPGKYYNYLKHYSGNKKWYFYNKKNINDVSRIGTVLFQGKMRGSNILCHIKFNANEFFRLIGWYISEGFIYGNNSNHGIAITQIKEKYKNDIEYLLNSMNLHWTYNGKDYIIKSELLYRFFNKEFKNEKSNNKYIPTWILDADKNLLECMFDSLIKGDGTITETSHIEYYTSSKRLSEQICELALKIGKSASLYTNYNKKYKKNYYKISIHNKLYRTISEKDSNWIDYSDVVWDITTQESNFLVERHGKIYFTGNCPFPYLMDSYVKEKMNRIPEWYNWQTVKTIVQSSGRSIRDMNDTAVTYILDQDFGWFYSKNINLFPIWWRKSIVK